MKIVKQSHEILSYPDNVLQDIEIAARTCYKSEDKITKGSAEKLVARLLKSGHEAMLEFGDVTIRFITNRGVTHELVRHRIGTSFAQESTRYVKYDGEMEFILPVWFDENEVIDVPLDQRIWYTTLEVIERSYRRLLERGWKAQQAREILPNSLKTEIVVKCNLRELRHILKLRCASNAHPQMYSLMRPLLKELQEKIPIIFDDITY